MTIRQKHETLARLERLERQLAEPTIHNSSFSAYRAWLHVKVAIQDLKVEILHHQTEEEKRDAQRNI